MLVLINLMALKVEKKHLLKITPKMVAMMQVVTLILEEMKVEIQALKEILKQVVKMQVVKPVEMVLTNRQMMLVV